MLHSIIQLLESIASSDPKEPPRLKVCDYFPDVPLTNQFGETFRFRKDFVEDGRALIINTMYTTCRGSCPGTSAAIQSLRQTLSPVFGNRLTILSITLEPRIDTPEVLHDYAGMYGADKPDKKLCHWHFLRTRPEDLEQLRWSLGFFDLDPRVDQDITQHASLLLVGNCTKDRWCMLPAELRHKVLVDSIRRLAGFTFEQRYGIKG